MQTTQLAKMHTFGPWDIAYKVTNVLCSDGIRRTARKLATADTYFSMPATITVKGKSVRGYVTGIETNGEQDYQFRQYLYCKNAKVLPEWSR